MLDDLLPEATTGNRTSIDIAATPGRVWTAFDELTLRDLKVTGTLMAARSVPSRIVRRGALGRSRIKSRDRPRTLAAALTAGRFAVLHDDRPDQLVLGIVGQFWKPSGGKDVVIIDTRSFVDFDEPGFVKSAIDFVVEPTATGSHFSTETRNQPTDDVAARRFGRYWRLVGWGSKAVRMEMVRAVKRHAER